MRSGSMWDERDGGFFDRAAEPDGGEPAIGLMRRPLKPFALNCDAVADAAPSRADVGRPANSRGSPSAPSTAMAAAAPPSQGPLAAHYVLAVRAAGPR